MVADWPGILGDALRLRARERRPGIARVVDGNRVGGQVIEVRVSINGSGGGGGGGRYRGCCSVLASDDNIVIEEIF